MSVKSADRIPNEEGQPPEENSGLGLLETFNLALSNIIRNPKDSPTCSSQSVSSPKKQRPQTLLSDDDGRDSSEMKFETYAQSKDEVMAADEQTIKQEDTLDHFDDYREWVDGNAKRRYCLTSREAQSHSSGWAMKYTNNHNKYVLKKTCVGVLVCSENCRLKDGTKIRIRPAISDKVRERQLGQQCPNSECKNGRIVHRKCTGNNGYPVTHFWVHHMDHIQFECKGTHDHPKPEAKRSSLKTRGEQSRRCNIDENSLPLEAYATYTQPFFPPYLHSEDLNNFARYVSYHRDYIRSCDVTDGNEHVCVATAPMRELAREIFSEENNDAKFSKAYVLCRTLPNYIPGFDLLESRLLSCATPECPLVLITLYRSGGVDGILEHIKHLTVMCSCPLQRIRVPKWHYLIHDFSRELKILAVETIVNLMVDAQMQTLLNEFQYKSVSSLYKMLRQRMMGTLRSFEEHYRICRYELMLRIQDPRVLASADDILARLQSQYCSAKEFLNIDALIKDGIIGDQVREFWCFWGSDIISSAVFPAAKIIYDSTLCLRHHSSIADNSDHPAAMRVQEGFLSLMEWLRKRSIIPHSVQVWTQPCRTSRNSTAAKRGFSYANNKLPMLLSYPGSYSSEQPSRGCIQTPNSELAYL